MFKDPGSVSLILNDIPNIYNKNYGGSIKVQFEPL